MKTFPVLACAGSLFLFDALAVSAAQRHDLVLADSPPIQQSTRPVLATDRKPSRAPNAVDQATDAGGGKRSASPDRSDVFAGMDTDRDGLVSASEYEASPVAAVDAVAHGKRQGSESDGGEFFRRWDTDGDSYLTRAEWEASQKPPAANAQ